MKFALLFLFFYCAFSQLTQTQKNQILAAHNILRQQVNPPAQTMPNLVWDTTLESTAQNYVSTCTSSNGLIVDHNPNRGTNVGENIYASTAPISNISDPVQSWFNEYVYYNYDTNTCQSGQVCGHYTQVVWAATTNVGCGIAACTSLSYPYTVLCDYSPAGNYVGQKPYVAATINNTQPAPTPNNTQPGPTPNPNPTPTNPTNGSTRNSGILFSLIIILFLNF